MMYLKKMKRKDILSLLSFTDRIWRKSTIIILVSKTCCCVQLTNFPVVPHLILAIFIDVFPHWTKRKSDKDIITVRNCFEIPATEDIYAYTPAYNRATFLFQRPFESLAKLGRQILEINNNDKIGEVQKFVEKKVCLTTQIQRFSVKNWKSLTKNS